MQMDHTDGMKRRRAERARSVLRSVTRTFSAAIRIPSDVFVTARNRYEETLFFRQRFHESNRYDDYAVQQHPTDVTEPSYFDEIANEILVQIFGYFDLAQQCQLRRVSQRWKFVLTSPPILRHVMLRNDSVKLLMGRRRIYLFIVCMQSLSSTVSILSIVGSDKAHPDEPGLYASDLSYAMRAIDYALKFTSFPSLRTVRFVDGFVYHYLLCKLAKSRWICPTLRSLMFDNVFVCVLWFRENPPYGPGAGLVTRKPYHARLSPDGTDMAEKFRVGLRLMVEENVMDLETRTQLLDIHSTEFEMGINSHTNLFKLS